MSTSPFECGFKINKSENPKPIFIVVFLLNFRCSFKVIGKGRRERRLPNSGGGSWKPCRQFHMIEIRLILKWKMFRLSERHGFTDAFHLLWSAELTPTLPEPGQLPSFHRGSWDMYVCHEAWPGVPAELPWMVASVFRFESVYSTDISSPTNLNCHLPEGWHSYNSAINFFFIRTVITFRKEIPVLINYSTAIVNYVFPRTR